MCPDLIVSIPFPSGPMLNQAVCGVTGQVYGLNPFSFRANAELDHAAHHVSRIGLNPFSFRANAEPLACERLNKVTAVSIPFPSGPMLNEGPKQESRATASQSLFLQGQC